MAPFLLKKYTAIAGSARLAGAKNYLQFVSMSAIYFHCPNYQSDCVFRTNT